MGIIFIVLLIAVWYIASRTIRINKENERLIKYKEALDILDPDYFLYWKGKELSELTDEELKEFNEFTGLNINQKGEQI